jgi:hypothetical protein
MFRHQRENLSALPMLTGLSRRAVAKSIRREGWLVFDGNSHVAVCVCKLLLVLALVTSHNAIAGLRPDPPHRQDAATAPGKYQFANRSCSPLEVRICIAVSAIHFTMMSTFSVCMRLSKLSFTP